ncbi:peptidase S8/S53 domain-containing protein [Lactarius quietus]|nr:peptidase S8/S53 domain-containing protein [Lactarius quietus]
MRCHLLHVPSTLFIALLISPVTPHVLPRWGGIKVMHVWRAVPQNWVTMGHPQAETTIDLYLALKSHNEDALTDTLYEISNPRHSKYGEYLSKEQVAELVAPHPETLEIVGLWLEHYGVPSSSISMTLGGNWLAVINVTVSQANKMLGASYELYRHIETNDTVLRTISYSLPEALHDHIKTVVPTTYFGSPEGMKQRIRPTGAVGAQEKAPPDEPLTGLSSRGLAVSGVTPAILRSLYETTTYVPTAAGRNRIGIGGFSGQYPSPQDLKQFMTRYRTDAVDATYTVEQVNGGKYDPSEPGVEGNIDIQYTAALAYPTPLIYYSTPGNLNSEIEKDPYINWIGYLLAQKAIPQTISVSYGGYEYNFPPDYAQRVCFLLAQLGLRGASVIFSSGDWGVGQGDCTFHDSTSNPVELFLPVFPATCPFVTSVGGTQGGRSDWDPEIASSLSSGGFSTYFPRPPYQAHVMPTFFENFGDKYSNYYNAQGRGFPDISAQAATFGMVLRGQFGTMTGTSGSAPTVAAIISLLNDYLISKDEPALGFLNPRLYDELLPGFKDITSGSNPGCGTDGFSAIVGWDPVTGLGTPNFTKLVELTDIRLKNSGASTSNPNS